MNRCGGSVPEEPSSSSETVRTRDRNGPFHGPERSHPVAVTERFSDRNAPFHGLERTVPTTEPVRFNRRYAPFHRLNRSDSATVSVPSSDWNGPFRRLIRPLSLRQALLSYRPVTAIPDIRIRRKLRVDRYIERYAPQTGQTSLFD